MDILTRRVANERDERRDRDVGDPAPSRSRTHGGGDDGALRAWGRTASTSSYCHRAGRGIGQVQADGDDDVQTMQRCVARARDEALSAKGGTGCGGDDGDGRHLARSTRGAGPGGVR
jgi:hypothetical protein